jgi:hypothetical protein
MRDRDDLADLMMAENGKSRTDATGEITYNAELFRWYAEEAVGVGGDYGAAPGGGARTVVTHRAVGVAALITPWVGTAGAQNQRAQTTEHARQGAREEATAAECGSDRGGVRIGRCRRMHIG